MRLLAFDTSTDQLSIAVQNGSVQLHVEQAGGPQASRQLLPQALALLEQAGLCLRALDAIVYGCGPGAFTGLRTACAAAQGLAWGAQLQALPVDSLLAIAEHARLEMGAQRVMAVLDARMHEVYAAPLRWQPAPASAAAAPASLAPGHWVREAPIRALPPAELHVPDGYVLAGNALEVYADALCGKACQSIFARPSALAMLSLAPGLIARGLLQAPAAVAPLYVRDKVAQTTEERERAQTQTQAKAQTTP